MRYWWVNQNQTYREEVRGGFMWSPKRNANGSRNRYYDNMLEVSPGDIVFSFCDTKIKAIGVITGKGLTGPKPDFGAAGANWSREGWYGPVDYCAVTNQIRPKAHIDFLRRLLPGKYSPLQVSGDGLQSVYLTEVPTPLANGLIDLIGQAYWEALSTIASARGPNLEIEEDPSATIPVGATFREQLVNARRGQGVFRSNVLLHETRCRVTGVSESRHLRASHIKPWRDSNDTERLDGANGLLLSPHIDHLFDQGFLTFRGDNRLLVIPEVKDKLVDAWGIDLSAPVGAFSHEQGAYLDYHFTNVFKKELLDD